jgi:small multidrug resistance family-3 protein
MEAIKTLGLFVATAAAEIVGCYLPYLWLKEGKWKANRFGCSFQRR